MTTNYTHSWIFVEGVKSHYIEAGTGLPFILIHGGGAGSSGEANYGDVIIPLSKYFHVIAPDVIGFGYTDPRGPEDFSGKAQGDFLVKFIETLDLGPVFLAGNSHGGFLSQYVAHERPELVKKLVIINSLNGTHPIPPLPEGNRYIYGISGHQSKKPTKERIRNRLERFYAHKDNVTEERVNKSYEITLSNYEFAAQRGSTVSNTVENSNKNLSYKGKHISEWASYLKIPVLLTWSEPGSKIEWGLGHFFKIPGCEMHLFPWSGHHVQTDQRDRWVQVVTNWLRNEPARPPEQQKNRMKRRWKDSWINVGDIKAHYIEAGKGDPIVLAHGGGPGFGMPWADTVNYLSEHFHAIAPDIIGAGFTAPRGPEDYPGHAQGDFLIKFIEALDVGPVYLAGQSHGGFLAQWVAHNRPELVKRLIISDSLNGTYPIPPLPEGQRYIYAAGGHQWRAPTKQLVRKRLESQFETKEITEELVTHYYENLVKTVDYNDKRGKNVNYSVEAANRNLSYKGKHISEWGSELKIPLMLLWSEPGSKIEWGLNHFFRVPGSEMHLFPWSGHGLHRDQVERWVQVVTNWLKNKPVVPPN
jgi:pimeloyl-ACP methyl ester carboxylesterase